MLKYAGWLADQFNSEQAIKVFQV